MLLLHFTSPWSDEFGQAFHSSRGAIKEARETFLNPAALDRFAAGSTLKVLELCVGIGTNTAALIEACQANQSKKITKEISKLAG